MGYLTIIGSDFAGTCSFRRLVNWDDCELPFGDPPSSDCPDAEILRQDIARRVEWVWAYQGMHGVLTLDTMRNTLQRYEDEKRGRFSRAGKHPLIGKFTWGQAVSPTDKVDQTANSDTPAKAADAGDA